MCRNRSFNGSGAATPKSSYGGGATPRSKMRSTGNFTLEDASKNFQVVVRVRPPLARELHGDRPFQCCVKVESERSITIGENLDAEAGIGPYQRHFFTFDRVYDQDSDQATVYASTAKAVVDSSLAGYNATIFAYGQTGTGKTYTMEGFNSAEARGIIPRAIEQIFNHIQRSISPRLRFLVRASYLQIYNEVISDLLKPERTNLLIREDKRRGVFVEGLSEWVVRSPEEIYGLMERGGTIRATGSTKMNHISSRSHAVFIIIAEQSETVYLDDSGRELSHEEFAALLQRGGHGQQGIQALESNVRQSFKVGKLNLVDLAGSERVRLTGATGQRLEESKKINQSLSALGNVIAALTDPKGRSHIPYRDSKLTRILEDSLGGNCKTTMMAMISPAMEAFVESLSTLKFANRAKNIKNEAKVNEDLDQKSLLRRYESELKRLRSELTERGQAVVDKRRVLELDEQRRRAEEDKMAAIQALERRSQEFMQEKAEKRRLEERIHLLQSQMLVGGGQAVEETPAFRSALQEQQAKMRAEYDTRLQELERERTSIEEEKAQVERYKQLLLKQRDIMILLTQRLNERDDQIVALQDELDAYDRHQKELEEKLDEKTTQLIHLQRVVLEHTSASPAKNGDLTEALGQWGEEEGGAHASSAGGAAPASAKYAPHSAPTVIYSSPSGKRHGAGGAAAGAGGAATGGRDASGNTGAAASGGMLTAPEKVAELQSLVESGAAEQARLTRELEEVRAEKVSMEYLLREKLEKLVQSEIEARLAAAATAGEQGGDAATDAGDAAGAAAAAALTSALHGSGASTPTGGSVHGQEVAQLASQLAQERAAAASARDAAAAAAAEAAAAKKALAEAQRRASAAPPAPSSGGDAAAWAAEAATLRARLETHDKERRAIETIMQQKLKRLVDNIHSIAQGSPADASGGQLSREIRALQRLVNACIGALAQSELSGQEAAAAAAAARPQS